MIIAVDNFGAKKLNGLYTQRAPDRWCDIVFLIFVSPKALKPFKLGKFLSDLIHLLLKF